MRLCAYIDNILFEEFIETRIRKGIPYDTYKTRNDFLKEIGTSRIVWDRDYVASETHFQYGFHYYTIPQGIYIKYNTSLCKISANCCRSPII